MKTINLLSVLLIISVHILAQVPQSFNYQAVVRDSNGELVTDQSVGVQISILKYGIYDLPVYIEDHNVLTNQFGLFSIMIGQGTQVMGEFEMIEWGSNTYFLQTAIDIGGENNYEFMGKTQLVSVPYSIYSRGLILTDENGNEYEITVDPSGNLVTNQILPFNCGDNLTDSRDGKIYLTVQIGNQCWMAENLNIGEFIGSSVGQSDNDIIEKYCYDNNSTNCDTYGGMYTWDELMEYTSDSVNQGDMPGRVDHSNGRTA